MDRITKLLVNTVKQITEQNRTRLTPTPGIDDAVDSQITSGQYDPERDIYYKKRGYKQTVKSGGEEFQVEYDSLIDRTPPTPEIHPITGQLLAGPPRPAFKLRLAGPPDPRPSSKKINDTELNPYKNEIVF